MFDDTTSPTIHMSVLKRFLVLFLPLAALLCAILLALFYTETRNERIALETKEMHTVKMQMDTIDVEFNSIISDLMILSGHQEIPMALENAEASHRKALSDEFLLFCDKKGIYDQIRLLDDNGMEIVRINYNDGNPSVVPESQLQDKANRYYFKEIFSLARGEVYVSPFDLNIERGKIEEPLKPVIRFGTPVFDSQGRKRGIVILNYLGTKLIHNFERIATDTPGHIMLLNSDGFWLKGPKPEDEWGFMFKDGRNRRFGAIFPDAWQRISMNESGQFYNTKGMFTFTTIYPLMKRWKTSDDAGKTHKSDIGRLSDNTYYWKIVSHIPSSYLYAGSRSLLNKLLILYVILLLFVATGCWHLARANTRSKLAEEAVRKSEKSLAEAQRIAHIGNWDWDIVNGKLRWSDEIYRIFGFTPRQFEENYETFLHVVHPDDRESVKTSINKAIYGKAPHSIDYRIVLSNGTVRFVHEQGELTFDEMGRPVRMIGTVQDITERKLMDDAFQALIACTVESEGMEFFEKIVSNTCAWLGTDCTIISELVNADSATALAMALDGEMIHQYSYTLSGTPCENVTHKGSCFYPEGVAAMFPHDKDLVEMGAEGYLGTALRNENGDPIGIFCTISRKKLNLPPRAKDVMEIIAAKAAVEIEHKRAKEALEKAKQIVKERTQEIEHLSNYQELILSNLNDYIRVIDPVKKVVQYESLRIKNEFGDGTGKPCYSFLNTERNCERCIAIEASENGSPLVKEENVNNKKYLVSAVPFKNTDGNISVIEVISDITEKSKLEEELEKTKELAIMGEAVSHVAHDIRNPLSSIKVGAELLEESTNLNEDEATYIKWITGGVVSLEGLVNEVLDFSRSRKLIWTRINLINLINETVSETAEMARKKTCGIKIEKELHEETIECWIDVVRFKSVLENLLANAVQAIEESGVIKVVCSLTNGGDTIMVKIVDDGQGIPEKDLEKIFEPFFTTKAKGTGLGMSIIKKFVEMHGGKVSVKSRLGEGTEVTIAVPMRRDRPSPS